MPFPFSEASSVFTLPLFLVSLGVTAYVTYLYTSYALKRQYQTKVATLEHHLLQATKGLRLQQGTQKHLHQQLDTLVTFIEKNHLPMNQVRTWVVALRDGLPLTAS